MTDTVVLGRVETPSGTLLILDPCYARHWSGAAIPAPIGSEPPKVDLAIVGPDAAEAGRRFNRQSDPLYLFDIPEAEHEGMIQLFEGFVTAENLQARAEVLPTAMPHESRARRAVESSGAGVVRFDGLWGVAIGGLPTDRPLEVVGELMNVGEFGPRFRKQGSSFPASRTREWVENGPPEKHHLG